MKIIADQDIPFIEHYFADAGELILKPGRLLVQEDLLDADMLIVRTVTTVNAKLLENTAVKFVGSVSSGADHLDINWLNQAGIKWFVAKGSNTQAVVEYVITIIAAAQKMALFPDKKLRAGVIGCGEIGSEVCEKLKILNFDIIQCDPLRAAIDKNFISTPINEFSDLDLITLHLPLTRDGDYPTWDLIDRKFLLAQKKNCVLLNTSRGAVIDSSDLEEYGELLYWCLDVWENEPLVNFEILALTALATPHIAGNTVQSKERGVAMVRHAASVLKMLPECKVKELTQVQKTLSFAHTKADWRDVVLKIYDPRVTTQQMKDELPEDGSGKQFDWLRKNFFRDEFANITLQDISLSSVDACILRQLGIETSLNQ
jgi:erythronate-4-phosphate dehydrogenase